MKLTVLGGSAAGTGIGQGCAGYLVQTDETSLVVDLGPGTLLELRRHTDYRTLDGVVISHLHADHIADIVALRFTLAYNPVPPPRRVPLWIPPDGIAMLERTAQAFDAPDSGIDWFSDVFDIHEYDPNGSVTVGDLTCSFMPTVHFVPCWAIRVRHHAEDADLVYTADTGPATDLTEFARGARVMIAEATDATPARQPHDERGHITPQEAASFAMEAGAATLVVSHMFEERDPEALMRAAEDIFDGTLVRATPGISIRWRS